MNANYPDTLNKRRGTKTAAATPATPPPAAPAAPASGDVALTPEAVQDMVKASVSEAVKGLATGDQLQAVIDKAIKSISIPEVPTAENIKAMVDEAIKVGIEGFKRENKMRFAAEEGFRAGQVEIPTSWCKGNLPLHGKQLLNALMKRPLNEGITEEQLGKAISLGSATLARMRIANKAWTSTTGSSGDELVPHDLSAEIQRRMYLASNLVAWIAPVEFDMPTNPYIWPILTTRPTFYLEATENTAATASTPGTTNVTLTAANFMAEVNASYQVVEDAIVPVLNVLEQQIAETAADTWEDVLINGDTTGTHMDSDTEAAGAKGAQRAFKGFRKLALEAGSSDQIVSFASGGITTANLLSLKKKLGKWGTDLRNLAFIVGVAGESDVLGVAEVLTADKAGPNATILTGRLPSIFSIPFITSAHCRENLNASGVYDGSTVTKGSLLLVNRSQFLFGNRREVMVETERDIHSQTHDIVCSFRKAFAPLETPSATITTLSMAYNYDSGA